MNRIGTRLSKSITRVMLLGCGELGKGVIIALQRLGCEPIGHVQVNGDYVESWQPMAMTPIALRKSRDIARTITGNLGGRGHHGRSADARQAGWGKG